MYIKIHIRIYIFITRRKLPRQFVPRVSQPSPLRATTKLFRVVGPTQWHFHLFPQVRSSGICCLGRPSNHPTFTHAPHTALIQCIFDGIIDAATSRADAENDFIYIYAITHARPQITGKLPCLMVHAAAKPMMECMRCCVCVCAYCGFRAGASQRVVSLVAFYDASANGESYIMECSHRAGLDEMPANTAELGMAAERCANGFHFRLIENYSNFGVVTLKG